MLIEFRVTNFRSFRDQAVLSLLAENIKSTSDFVDENNTFAFQGLKLLRSAVIYGANASGKSNLLQAFSTMKMIVTSSSLEGRTGHLLPIQPFLLSESVDAVSTFEIIFFSKEVRYRYGFSASKERITEEWLYKTAKVREKLLFERKIDKITINRDFSEGKGIEPKTRPNSLFLSVVDQFNGKISGDIIAWFNQTLVVSNIMSFIEQYSIQRLSDAKSVKNITDFLRSFDVGIDELKIEKIDVQDILTQLPLNFKGLFSGVDMPEYINSPKSLHNVYNDEGDLVKYVEFDFQTQESDGTRKLLSLSAPILDALSSGRVVLLDELDSNLHPLLCEKLISLFNDNKINSKNAQLIFTTHNVGILRNSVFRRDQIWFVEKSIKRGSVLYSLLEYKVRNDSNYSKDYLNGRYGAIPFINANLFLGDFQTNAG